MKRLKLLVILSIVFTILLIDTENVFCLDGKIYKNIYINEVDVSRLSKEQCKEKLSSYLEKNRYIKLKYKNNDIIIDKNQLGVVYNIKEAIEAAYNLGRDKSVISNLKKKISLSRGQKEVILLKYVYDSSKLENMLEAFDERIGIRPIDATLEIVDGEIILTKDRYGQAIDREKLKKIILNSIESFDTTEYEIPINILQPRYTYERLKKIDTLLGSYETSFGLKNENRVNNISVAALATGSTIIEANEEFSFNNILEKSGQRNKLKEAPIIINGRTDKGIGGGICQVSTTIYNAALYAGMEIVDITNHSIPSFYAEKGRDATVSQGSIDFVFKNIYSNPIFIYNKIDGNTIRTEIYGSHNDKKYIEIGTEIVKIITNNRIYKLDSNVEKGLSVVEQKGRLGYKVNTFRIYRNKQAVVKKELVNTSYYPPCDEIILIGNNKNYGT